MEKREFVFMSHKQESIDRRNWRRYSGTSAMIESIELMLATASQDQLVMMAKVKKDLTMRGA